MEHNMQFFLSNLFDILYLLSHFCNTYIIFVITKIFKYKNLFYGNNIKYFKGTAMIDYSPFWETLKKTNENWYTLTSKHHMSHSTLHRLKHNQDISMKTVNDLCRILHCQIQDICVYVPSDEDQPL